MQDGTIYSKHLFDYGVCWRIHVVLIVEWVFGSFLFEISVLKLCTQAVSRRLETVHQQDAER